MFDDDGKLASPSVQRLAIIDLILQVACVALVLIWAALLLKPFLTVILWSIVLAVVLYPTFQWMVGKLHMPAMVAALLITAFSLAVLFGPAAWLGLSLIDTLHIVAARLSAGDILLPRPPDSIKTWPLVGPNIHAFWLLASTNLKGALAQIAPHLQPYSSTILDFASSTALSMAKFVTAVLLSGFLLVPGPALVESARTSLRRLTQQHGDEFVDLIGSTIRNLARGIIGLSLLQALLAGVGFIVAGIPAAGFLSFLILLFGIVQVDAAFVTIPVAIWAWLKTDTTVALLLTLYLIPVTLLNNVVRPFVMAHGLKTPAVVIFAGVLGGLLLHGLIGLFVGPIVLAIVWELLRAWSDRKAPSPPALG